MRLILKWWWPLCASKMTGKNDCDGVLTCSQSLGLLPFWFTHAVETNRRLNGRYFKWFVCGPSSGWSPPTGTSLFTVRLRRPPPLHPISRSLFLSLSLSHTYTHSSIYIHLQMKPTIRALPLLVIAFRPISDTPSNPINFSSLLERLSWAPFWI